MRVPGALCDAAAGNTAVLDRLVDSLAASWGCGGQGFPAPVQQPGVSVLSDKSFLFISSVCS